VESVALNRIPKPVIPASLIAWRNGAATTVTRALPEETAVALTYDRVSFAVMMASPTDLTDFAIGFSLSEGIIENIADITGLEIITVEAGIECRMTLNPKRHDALELRRRKIAGPTGCGLCGIDSLEQAVRPPKKLQSSVRILATVIADGIARMARQQLLNLETRAVHAAAFLNPASGEILLREDVGRHNALDKLIGAVTAKGETPGLGVVLLTSRVSIELIQKTAMLGAPILAAVSVPTARAVREAEKAGITLIAVARDDGFEILTRPERILLAVGSQIARPLPGG
jgi:FdhD protein